MEAVPGNPSLHTTLFQAAGSSLCTFTSEKGGSFPCVFILRMAGVALDSLGIESREGVLQVARLPPHTAAAEALRRPTAAPEDDPVVGFCTSKMP